MSCDVPSCSVNRHQGTHQNVSLLGDLQTRQSCCFPSCFQEPLELYPRENQMVGSSLLGHFQSHGGSLNTGLWPWGLSTRGSDPIYLNHSHSPCEVNLEGVLKKRQMIITMATGCTINVGSFCQTNSCLSPFTFSLIVD